MQSNTILPRVDTAQIVQLRGVLERYSALKSSLGSFVQFRVIVDANFIIQELTQHLRYPARGKTALEELIVSTVVKAYAPRWLDCEMPSAIKQAAKKMKLSEQELLTAWKTYRTILIWEEDCGSPIASVNDCDPKDRPYVDLESKIDAHGILTKDPHIKKMGGHPLTLDFLLSARTYARTAVITVGIQLCGTLILAVSLKAALELLRNIFASFKKPMNALTVSLSVCAVLLLCSPRFRKWATEKMEMLVGPAFDCFLDAMTQIAQINISAQTEASTHLGLALASARPRAQKPPGPYRRKRTAPLNLTGPKRY